MKRFCFALLVLGVAVSGCGPRISDNERLNTALKELENGDLKKSNAQIEAVLKNNPDNCSARLLKAP